MYTQPVSGPQQPTKAASITKPGQDSKALTAEEKAARKAEEKAAKAEEKARRQAEQRKRQIEAADAQLHKLQMTFAQVSQERSLCLACVDLEAWEEDTGVVTEIGLALVWLQGTGQAPRLQHRHLLITEHLDKRNGRFVADARDRFLFGDSELLPLEEAVQQASQALGAADYIVGHAIGGDLRWLEGLGVQALGRAGAAGARFVDTQALAFAGQPIEPPPEALEQARQRALRSASAGGSSPYTLHAPSLRHLAEHYQLEPEELHNGGNDAAFTLQVMLSQCRVAFTAPERGVSQHTRSEGFLACVAEREAQARQREAQLRADVAAFATQVGAAPRAPGGEEGAAGQGEAAALRGTTRGKRKRRGKAGKGGPAAEAAGAGGGAPAVPEDPPAAAGPEFCFPPTLTANQRKFVHFEAEKHGLVSCSRGEGKARYVSISLPRTA